MCGRVKLSTDFSEIRIAFRIPPEYPTPNTYAPSWNVAPTDSLPIVRYNDKAGHRTLDMMRWGLVPHWAKRHKDRLLDDQRYGRDGRREAGVPRGVQAPPLPCAGR